MINHHPGPPEIEKLAEKIAFFFIIISVFFPLTRADSPYGEAAAFFPAGIEPGRTASVESLDDEKVYLRWRAFDPSEEGGGAIEANFEGFRIFIVQFRSDISLRTLRGLEDADLVFLEKIPRRSYLVKASKKGLSKIQELKEFRDSFLLRPEDKADPSLLSGQWKEPVIVEALIARGESPSALVSRIRSESFLAVLGDEEKGPPAASAPA